MAKNMLTFRNNLVLWENHSYNLGTLPYDLAKAHSAREKGEIGETEATVLEQLRNFLLGQHDWSELSRAVPYYPTHMGPKFDVNSQNPKSMAEQKGTDV